MRVVLGALNGRLLTNIAIEAVPFCSHVDAAVAYAVGNDHPLLRICKEKQIRLTFYGLLDEDGAVNGSFLKELLAWGPSRADARLVNGYFHSKVIWWRGYGAYIGSANLTRKAWFNNVEAGVFVPEDELIESGAGADLDDMFAHLAEHSLPVTAEVVAKLDDLERSRQQLLNPQRRRIGTSFEKLFGQLPKNSGLTAVRAKGERVDRARGRFVTEWMQTLQLIRGLTAEFAELGLRPTWVDPDAHPAVHFDQFLHAYFYDYVRGADANGDEEALSTVAKVEEFFARHRANPKAALVEAARWWASLPVDPHGEGEFIRVTAPMMQARLSRDAVQRMDLAAFREAFATVNAFRMHARQVRNAEFGLPPDHHESMAARVDRLCGWLWDKRSAAGKTVRDVLDFVLWGADPTDMEQRLWLAVWSSEFRLPHFGQSSLGEAVGWARPNDYPPRNNRTNKALRSLGHDVKLFSNG